MSCSSAWSPLEHLLLKGYPLWQCPTCRPPRAPGERNRLQQPGLPYTTKGVQTGEMRTPVHKLSAASLVRKTRRARLERLARLSPGATVKDDPDGSGQVRGLASVVCMYGYKHGRHLPLVHSPPRSDSSPGPLCSPKARPEGPDIPPR